MKYETMKIMSRGDQAIRFIMIDHCYIEAGEDEVQSHACDLVERDLLECVWKGLPFHKILAMNTKKYRMVDGEIDSDRFINLIEIFMNFGLEFFELMNEIDSHKEITILRLKKLIDERTKVIIQEGYRYQDEDHKHHILTH